VVAVNISNRMMLRRMKMKRAAGMLASGRKQTAAFEARARERLVVAPSSAYPGNESTVGATSHAALISVMTAAFVTLWVEAALKFQKYRFDSGLMLGTTLAAVNWFEDVARRKNLRPSRLTLVLIATIAAAFTVALQQAVRVLAAGLPSPITHS
jgi:hypothetical protein